MSKIPTFDLLEYVHIFVRVDVFISLSIMMMMMMRDNQGFLLIPHQLFIKTVLYFLDYILNIMCTSFHGDRLNSLSEIAYKTISYNICSCKVPGFTLWLRTEKR